MFVVLLILFVFGLAIGSFLNVVIYRSVHDESWVVGRSKCPHCHKQIAWFDNIPLVSYVLLRGHCRACRKPISWAYPMIEFITGALFVWWYVIGATVFRLTTQPLSVLQPAFWLIVGICLLVIFFADALYGIIPDGAVILLAVLGFAYRWVLTATHVMQPVDFWWSLAAGVGASGVFWGLRALTRSRGMGWGDVKFVFPLGLILGLRDTVVGVFLAFVMGAIVGVALIGFKKKKLGQTLPFGPFLVAGAMLALLFGDQLVQWYIGLLL